MTGGIDVFGVTLIGVLLVPIGFAVTIAVYLSQQVKSENQQIDATLGVLRFIIDGMKPWSDDHFGGQGYNEEQAIVRAARDRQCVRDGVYFLNYRVPSELIANLVEHEGTRVAISSDTMAKASEALRRVEIFNQVVQQQTDFLAFHLPAIYNRSTDTVQREAIADTAFAISKVLHESTIGDAAWYRDLMTAIDRSIVDLEKQKRKHWWNRRKGLTMTTNEVIVKVGDTVELKVTDRDGKPQDNLVCTVIAITPNGIPLVELPEGTGNLLETK